MFYCIHSICCERAHRSHLNEPRRGEMSSSFNRRCCSWTTREPLWSPGGMEAFSFNRTPFKPCRPTLPPLCTPVAPDPRLDIANTQVPNACSSISFPFTQAPRNKVLPRHSGRRCCRHLSSVVTSSIGSSSIILTSDDDSTNVSLSITPREPLLFVIT